MPAYLTVGEVSSLLRKSQKWTYQNADKLPGFFRLGGSIYFDKEVLERGLRELAEGKVKARSDNRHGL